jgi:hypothetical protein
MLRPRRPFWLPASNYYVLASGTVLGVFFLAWGVLQDSGEPSPWIVAGVLGSSVLVVAVLLREVFLRSARNRFQMNQRRLDQSLNLNGLHGAARRTAQTDKFTLERNAAIIGEIKRKSEAARVLGKFAEGHREVVDMCIEYIAAAERELPTVGVGSPRIAALQRGKHIAREVHHYHMLQWAEIESRALTQEANNHVKITDRLETAQKAVGVVDYALNYYPHDDELRDSRSALTEFVASIKLSHLIEKAERSAFNGNHARAIKHFQDALFFLSRQSEGTQGQDAVAQMIAGEIERLQQLTSNEGSGGSSGRSRIE